MFSDSRSTRIVSTTSVVWLDAIQSVDPTRARADVCPERRRDGQRDASRPEALTATCLPADLRTPMRPGLANSPVKVIPSRVRLEDFCLERSEPLERGLDCLA